MLPGRRKAAGDRDLLTTDETLPACPLLDAYHILHPSVRAAAMAAHPAKPEFALLVVAADGASHVLACPAASPVPTCIWKLAGQSRGGGRTALTYSWHSSCGGKSKPTLLASNGSQVRLYPYRSPCPWCRLRGRDASMRPQHLCWLCRRLACAGLRPPRLGVIVFLAVLDTD